MVKQSISVISTPFYVTPDPPSGVSAGGDLCWNNSSPDQRPQKRATLSTQRITPRKFLRIDNLGETTFDPTTFLQKSHIMRHTRYPDERLRSRDNLMTCLVIHRQSPRMDIHGDTAEASIEDFDSRQLCDAVLQP